MLTKKTSTCLLAMVAVAAHGQGAIPSKASWPQAVQIPPIRIDADYSIAEGASVMAFAPSITSKTAKSVGFRKPIKADNGGTLHLSPGRCWTRETAALTPWDSISVVTLSGNAVDGHDADFQLDAHTKMHIEPTGFIDPPGTMALFAGEGAGWCKLSLDGSQGARTWSNFLSSFTPEPVRRVGSAAIYEGKSPLGWDVSIKTNAPGTQLYSVEVRNTKTMNATRRLVFDKWLTVDGFTLPVEGTLDYAFAMNPGAKPTETTHAVFQISNVRPASHEDPPWVNGMQFRSLVVRHDIPGKFDSSSYKLIGSKLFPMRDLGNVFKEPSQGGNAAPYVVAIGLFGIGSGAVLLSRTSRRKVA